MALTDAFLRNLKGSGIVIPISFAPLASTKTTLKTTADPTELLPYVMVAAMSHVMFVRAD